MEQLARTLQDTLTPDANTRRRAEETLAQLTANTPDAPAITLSLLSAPTTSHHIRQAAAVFFKNLVKNHWDAEATNSIPQPLKAQLRDTLLPLFLTAPDAVQAQLCEAISLIAAHDFPNTWDSLLPMLVAQLDAAIGDAVPAPARDYRKGRALLLIAHALFRRYRHAFKSDELFREIKYALGHVHAPLLRLFKATCADLAAAAAQPEQCRVVLAALTTMVALHHDLVAQELPEEVEDHFKAWMEGFAELLAYAHPALAADDDDAEPSPISVLQSEVVEVLSLHLAKDEEVFNDFLPECLKRVWALLVGTTLAPHQDLLVTTSIRFLTTVATSVHHAHFAQPVVLQEICQKIIAPNMQLLQADEELFDDTPFEYVKKDIEGSDSDTRRRVACELVRGLCAHYEKEVTSLFSGSIASLLEQYAASPAANWKAKDVATYLVIALTTRASTSTRGATQTNALVDIGDFFAKHVQPELQAAAASTTSGAAAPAGATGSAVLAAAGIKFVTVFRAQLGAAAFAALFPALVTLLGHPHVVVHTYAANAIERMLTVRSESGAPLYGAAELVPQLGALLTALFALLGAGGSAGENAYAMRAIMRVTVVVGEGMAPYASTCIESLKSILARVCENPTNPAFNHYLFETVAALVRYICAATPAAVDAFEQLLFPPFQTVLRMDIAEFTPYVFQILSQLLECRHAVSAAYASMFPPLLAPTMWERPGNVPPLTRLLVAYVAHGGRELVLPKLESVLGVFQKLLARGATDPQASRLHTAVGCALDLTELERFVTPHFDLCLRRASTYKKVGTSLGGTWSVFVARYGAVALRARLEALQAGLSTMAMRGLWSEYAGFSAGATLRKTVIISTARLLSEVPELLDDAETAGALLLAAMRMLEADAGIGDAALKLNAQPDEADDGVELAGTGESGYAAAFVQLSFAKDSERDLYPGEVASRCLGAAVNRMAAQRPDVMQRLAATLPAEQQQRLAQLTQAAQ